MKDLRDLKDFDDGRFRTEACRAIYGSEHYAIDGEILPESAPPTDRQFASI
jgi:hypothetical protein